MNFFAVTSGIQIGLYALLALKMWQWKRHIASITFLLMAGRAISDLFLFLELREFPVGVLGQYDAAIFPMVILLGWLLEMGWTRWYRWYLRYGKPWTKQPK